MAIEITEVKRRFRYNGVTLPDVAGLSNQQVRDLYSAQYPELMSADIEVGEVAVASRTSPSGARSARRADAGRVERYATLLDLQLHGGSDSATGALEEALGRRRLVEAGQAIGEFASVVSVKGERRDAPLALPFPSEGLPPMP